MKSQFVEYKLLMVKRKMGMIEEADGGTLFLDEIGDMSLETQAKLLRVLQENEFQRVGGTKVIPFDVRIISATNKNIDQEIEQGNFRQDLYFRINVVPIYVPALKDRKEDIPQLVNHFLKIYSIRNNKKQKLINNRALQPFMGYHWPGNIRELKNLIERLVIMTEGEIVSYSDTLSVLPATSSLVHEMSVFTDDHDDSLREKMEKFEKRLLINEFQKASGNVSQMAHNLKTDRPNLHRKLKKFNIK